MTRGKSFGPMTMSATTPTRKILLGSKISNMLLRRLTRRAYAPRYARLPKLGRRSF
jgi:hypothetical protein